MEKGITVQKKVLVGKKIEAKTDSIAALFSFDDGRKMVVAFAFEPDKLLGVIKGIYVWNCGIMLPGRQYADVGVAIPDPKHDSPENLYFYDFEKTGVEQQDFAKYLDIVLKEESWLVKSDKILSSALFNLQGTLSKLQENSLPLFPRSK